MPQAVNANLPRDLCASSAAVINRHILAGHPRARPNLLCVITAFNSTLMREAATGADFNDYLIKPFGFDDIDSISRIFFPEHRP
ncbi:MAG: hypothetical protein LC802_23180 [Acidobacteria bacterium]|nr:hypothetical protein [Acidobacteriota bacterium]